MGSVKLLLAAISLATVALAVACDGEEGRGPGGSQGLTDPKTVPSTTPWATPPPVVYVEEGPAPPGPSQPDSGTYTVEAGDTASDIAAAFGISVEALAEANGMTVDEIANLSIGQELIIPAQEPEDGAPDDGAADDGAPEETPPTETETPVVAPPTDGQIYVVQEGDYPGSIAEQFDITVEELMEANGITDPTGLQVGQELIIPTPTP